MEMVLLVADLPAKASLLETSQLKDFFGCTLCLKEAKRNGRNHFYPQEDFPMRDPEKHKRHIEDCLENASCLNYLGVEGRSVLIDVLPN